MGSFNASLKTIGDPRGIPASVELQEGRLSIKAGDSEIGDWPLDEVALEPTPTGYKLAAEGDQVLLDMTDSEQFAEELSVLSKNGARKRRSLFSRKKRAGGANVEESPSPVEPEEPEQPEEAAAPRETVSSIPASLMAAPPSAEPAPVEEPVTRVSEAAEEPQEPGEGPSLFTRLVAMLDRTIDASERRWGPLLPRWVFTRGVFVAGIILVVLAFVFRGTTSVVLLVAGVLALMVGGAAYTDDVMASKLLPGRATPTHLLLAGVGLLAVGIGFGLIA